MQTFEQFAVTRGPALLRLAVMLTGNAHDAEDLLQSTFVTLLRHWSRVAGAGRPDAYARKVLVNEHLSWRRRTARREHPSDPGSLPEHASPVGEDPGPQDPAWRLLATLPRRQRAVLALRYYEDLSDADIAEVLACSPSTVRSNASRGLASLRTVLDPSAQEVAP